jgi:hypothetical protein
MAEMSLKADEMKSLLSIEISPEGDELFVHGDPAGLRRLSAVLEQVAASAERGEFPHEHLFANEWGGDDLASEAQESGHRCLMHVKVLGWPDSRGAKPYQKLVD